MVKFRSLLTEELHQTKLFFAFFYFLAIVEIDKPREKAIAYTERKGV